MFEWLKKVIDKSDNASSKNLLAVFSGFILGISFLYTIVIYPANSTQIATLSAALVLLATFHKSE